MSRNWTKTDELISQEHGSIIKSSRSFGVEIECIDNKRKGALLEKEMNPAIGIGGDGSLSSGGVEVRTPPASGKAGEDMIKTLGASLKGYGFDVNHTCGLHVHIDAIDMLKRIQDKPKGYEKLKNLWLFYMVFDPVVRSFIPRSRRENHYCQAMQLMFSAVKRANSLDKLHHIYDCSDPAYLDRDWEMKDPTRYRGINLQPLFDHWHFEVRYHEGTIDPTKILHWANLHALIMDRVMEGEINRKFILHYKSSRSIKTKTEALFRILKLSKPSELYFLARQAKNYKKYPAFFTEEVKELTNKI